MIKRICPLKDEISWLLLLHAAAAFLFRNQICLAEDEQILLKERSERLIFVCVYMAV